MRTCIAHHTSHVAAVERANDMERAAQEVRCLPSAPPPLPDALQATEEMVKLQRQVHHAASLDALRLIARAAVQRTDHATGEQGAVPLHAAAPAAASPCIATADVVRAGRRVEGLKTEAGEQAGGQHRASRFASRVFTFLLAGGCGRASDETARRH